MKKLMKRIGAVLMAVAMMAALGVGSALAQTESLSPADKDNATITVNNAAKGETYKVVKLFDATVTGTTDGSIAYQGTIPSALSSLFYKDTAGNIHLYRVKDSENREPDAEGYVDTYAEELTAEQFKTLKTWADGQTATASAVSDGSVLEFTGLPYGYYVITSTQGATVTVDSTNPSASIYDKNTKELTAAKTVDDDDINIGDKVTYTATFDTYNYEGAGKDAKKVVSYRITDTLPSFLTDVSITGLKVVETPAEEAVEDDPSTDENEAKAAVPEKSTDLMTTLAAGVTAFPTVKYVDIPWVDTTTAKNSLYKNGSQIVVTYEATVTADAKVGGAANVNKVTIQPYLDTPTGTPEPSQNKEEAEEEIYTYAAMLKKVDEKQQALKGAKFAVKGLTVAGNGGHYTVTSYNPEATTDGTEMETDANGYLVIAGLNSDASLSIEETVAPDGYNKLTAPETLTPQKTSSEITKSTTTTYYDADGNVTSQETTNTAEKTTYDTTNLVATALVIVNQKGSTLPSTGGIGTYVFTVAGVAIMAIAAGLLIVRHKKKAE